jgi:hypothetical protein
MGHRLILKKTAPDRETVQGLLVITEPAVT